MTSYLIIGAGQQGQVVASYLADQAGNQVNLADCQKEFKAKHPRVCTTYFDARDVTKGYRNILGAWFASHDVVISCLPSQFGGPCVALAAEFGANYVDLSYTTDNLFLLDPLAQHTGCTIIPDVGLAPGLPNLITGHYLKKYADSKGHKLPQVDIYVGGVSLDPKLPLGYVETWSLEDLYEEYVRPGRYIENGEEVVVSPTDLGALRDVQLNGQKFEAFTSDGLRTLLAFKKVVPNVREWTLRYPGHMEKVKNMLYGKHSSYASPLPKEDFVNLFRSQLSKKGLDRVVLAVDCAGERMHVVVDGDDKVSAMSRTTAYTTAVVASTLAAHRQHFSSGVQSMELIGRDNLKFNRILAGLSEVGVTIQSDINKPQAE